MSDSEWLATVTLVRNAQHGDRSALERLFGRYLPRVRQIVALRIGLRMRQFVDHEDLVQDALLRAFRDFEHFEQRAEGSFRNWLAHCVESAVVDRERQALAHKRGAGKVRRFRDLPGDSLMDSIFPGKEPTPSQLAQAGEAQEIVEATLLDLPEHHRELIVLRHLCGLSYEEIAAEMHFARAETARRASNRALELLRSQCSRAGISCL